MANIIRKATNKFLKGLVMDFSPENTRNEVLTHALNATLLTFNGNEMSLQNDMGNARVETAYLPEGYMPVGTCEYGGIVYIVSYNPLENKSQIGCFPSPERNISIDEMGLQLETTLNNSDFQLEDGNIKNSTKYVLLRNDKLNPGDKFIIYANEELYEEKLANLETKHLIDGYKKEQNPILALNIVSIEDSGKITYLDSSVRTYEVTKYIKENFITKEYNLRYPILGKANIDQPLKNEDIDEYRNVLSSGYNVFKSKTSGKLAILAELIMIDSYSVTHRIEEVKDENGQTIPDKYNIVLYPEVSYEETEQKYDVKPKLSYYYLEKSDGILQLINDSGESDVETNSNTNRKYKSLSTSSFFNTLLKNVWSDLDPKIQTTVDSSGNTIDYTLGMLYDEYYNDDNYKVNSKLSPIDFGDVNRYHKNNIYNINNDLNPILLGTIILPDEILNNTIGQSLQLPFTYKYTIVPCMSYGKLQNLAVSNTIDFLNINNFNASKFNVWKYRVDGPTVHLQFGAEVYDTSLNEDEKVTALVLEFYDLWGFAGSIIIDNKKAYSGVFTKILTLNSINQLSNNKVPYIQNIGDKVTGEYSTDYQRNIKIIQNYDLNNDSNNYFLNESEIKFENSIGWRNSDGTDIENDCGTLYQNLIYGVKAYFVQDNPNDSDQKQFTFKDQFFMFTNPLFNDYYYTVNNFNNLSNPELDFVFTSRIKDSSIKESLEYNNGNLIIENGYKSGSKISEYIKGSSTEINIQDTKYYKYKGTSELQLEIGLKKDYESIGLSYDRNINKYFSCDLKLINTDNDGSWSVESDSKITDKNILLNYSEDDLRQDPNLNSLQFSNEPDTLHINYNTLQYYHFLDPNDQSGAFIPIKYEFVVGYSVTINDIRDTQIPSTTVCALCHKRDDGSYNYEDFGIEEGVGIDDNPIYLSSTIFYNSGTNTDVHFGLCKQLSTFGNALEQCSIIDSSEYDAVKIQTPRILNTGDPLKEMLPYIGKLTFCEPHLSGYSETNGVSVSPDNGIIQVNPDLSLNSNNREDHNFTYGIVPSDILYKSPQYLLCANTKNMINRQSEFIVNMDHITNYTSRNAIYIGYKENKDPIGFAESVNALKFIGLTGEQLTQYNKKLLETMKGIYAYNPDYNSLIVKAGDVSILDNKIRFTSNIISENADINFDEGKTLNDFISLGNMRFTSYFENLNKHSNNSIIIKDGNSWIPQINFTENVDYCGGKNNKALISNLVYNTPDISELYDELTFNNNTISIRHENGELSYIKGDLNTKTLYGYKSDTNQLIQLDVSNYEINSDGELSIKTSSNIYSETAVSIDNSEIHDLFGFNKPVPSGIQTTITIGDIELPIKITATNQSYTTLGEGDTRIQGGYVFFISDKNQTGKFTINVELNGNIPTNKRYELKCSSIKLGECSGRLVQNNEAIRTLNADELYALCTPTNGSTNEDIDSYDPNIRNYLDLEVIPEVIINGTSWDGTNNIENYINTNLNYDYGEDRMNVWFIKIEELIIHVTEYTDFNREYSENIIHIIPTSAYLNISNDSYQVNTKYQNACFRGTSITINDLVYEPNPDGHRLYMRPNCFKYHNTPRARLYYRTLTPDENSNISTTWKGDTDYYNMLFINTGPCFVPDNLS